KMWLECPVTRWWGGGRAKHLRLGGLGAIYVVQVVAVQRRDRVGMECEPGFAGHAPDDRLHDGTGRALLMCRVDPDDHKAAERLDLAERSWHPAREARLGAQVGVKRGVAEQVGRTLRRYRLDRDLVRVIGWIDRQLVTASRHAHSQKQRCKDKKDARRFEH